MTRKQPTNYQRLPIGVAFSAQISKHTRNNTPTMNQDLTMSSSTGSLDAYLLESAGTILPDQSHFDSNTVSCSSLDSFFLTLLPEHCGELLVDNARTLPEKRASISFALSKSAGIRRRRRPTEEPTPLTKQDRAPRLPVRVVIPCPCPPRMPVRVASPVKPGKKSIGNHIFGGPHNSRDRVRDMIALTCNI